MSTQSRSASFTMLLLTWCLHAVLATGSAISINCDKGEKGQTTLNKLNLSGPNTIKLSGTGDENLTIQGSDRLTLMAMAGDRIKDSSGGVTSSAVAQVIYSFTTVDVPSSVFTRVHNINRQGDMVGLFDFVTGVRHGFVLHNGGFKQLDFPGSTFTSARGINSLRQIVGGYADSNDVDHGFLLANGQYTTIDFPGAAMTDAYDINDAGVIVGDYVDSSGLRRSSPSMLYFLCGWLTTVCRCVAVA